MLTICFTHYKGLTLANLDAALYSMRRQNFSTVKSLVIVDNDSADSATDILSVIDALSFPVPVEFYSVKHGDSSKTHSWSTNRAVSYATTDWVFFTRADYILDESILDKFVEKANHYNVFISADGYHLDGDVAQCEQAEWRRIGAARLLQLAGTTVTYTKIDSGVWMLPRLVFNAIRGLDETLTAWGHAQTEFQHRLYLGGTDFVRIPEVLFYHPMHAGERDLSAANLQLHQRGVSLREMWARHDGPAVY